MEQEEYSAQKKKNMLGSKFLLPQSLTLFERFVDMLATCCMSNVVLAGYPVSQNTKCTTKLARELLVFGAVRTIEIHVTLPLRVIWRLFIRGFFQKFVCVMVWG